MSTDGLDVCDRAQQALLQGGPLSDDLRAHVERCPACEAVRADDAALARKLMQRASPDAAVPEALRVATRGLVEADRGPFAWLRARSSVQRGGLALVALLLAVGWQARLHPERNLLDLAGHAAAYVAACALLLWPLGRPLPVRARAFVVGVAFLLPVAFAFAQAHGVTESVATSPWPCFAYGSLLAVPFLLLFKLLDRNNVWSVPQAVLGGGLAGLSGNALLHLHCPSTELAHLMLGHALLGIALAVGALAWARRASKVFAQR